MEALSNHYAALVAEAYINWKDEVFAVFRQSHIDIQECEDLTQNTFVRLMGMTMLNADTMKSLVFTIAYRLRVDYFRHLTYSRSCHSENHGFCQPYEDDVDHRMTVLDIETTERRAMERLSDVDQIVYSMTRFEYLNVSEISKMLGLKPRTVEARLYRARRSVRQYMRQAIGF
jgi:RNA polymerase sigma factor (sigma-70 family)